MKIKKCKWCGSAFKSSKRHKKYCSKLCALNALKNYRQKKNKEWCKKNRDWYNEYMRIYMQQYRKKHKKRERFYLKAGTIYLKNTKNWNEELKLLEKFLRPIHSY